MQLSEAREEYVRWLLATRDLSHHTIRAYSSDIIMLERHFGQKAPVDQLEQAPLVAFIEQQRAGGLGSASVRRRVSGLRGFCKWLVARGLLSSDPWAGATIAIRRARNLPRALPAYDLDRLLRSLRAAARIDENSVVSPEEAFQRTTLLAVILMVTTGVRVSEVVSIKCHDIDLAGRSIRIIGKGRRERHVFLTNPWICRFTSEYLEMRTTLGVVHPYLLFNMSLGPLTTSAVRASR
jgi:integrase/recombinase XerD